jgi:cytochrome P450
MHASDKQEVVRMAAYTAESSKLWFDPNTITFAADPYPQYRRLRDESPVYHYSGHGPEAWILSRYEDVSRALDDWQTFSSVNSMTERHPAPGARGTTDGDQLITTDPPLHDRLREIVREHLSPKAIRALEPEIEHEVLTHLRGLAARDTVDIACDFAWAVSLAVISSIIGIPADDRRALLAWYQAAEYSKDKDLADAALSQYTSYFEELACDRSRTPNGDLLTAIMQAVAQEEVSRPDGLMLAKDIFEGGADVPANLIGNAVLALRREPSQRALVADDQTDAARVRLAVEEVARYDAPIQALPRRATRTITMHGVQIPKDGLVLLLLGSANRDERRFADPDTVDVTRPAARNVAFGSGVHFCIGGPLARLEARIALPRLFAAIPEYQVEEPIERPPSQVMRAILRLPLRIA